jgi:hypothetical protein
VNERADAEVSDLPFLVCGVHIYDPLANRIQLIAG